MSSQASASRAGAGLAALLGALALLALPVAVVAAQFTSLELLQTLYVVVPIDVALAFGALGAQRRARFDRARRVRPGSAALLRTARVLAYLGAYAAITGALALGVYGILRWAQ